MKSGLLQSLTLILLSSLAWGRDGLPSATPNPVSLDFERASGAVFTRVNYDAERVKLQDEIALSMMGPVVKVQKPRIIFTAGGYGAGKSTVMKMLAQTGFYDPKTFVDIDPDEIKYRIPEYSKLLVENPGQASQLVHQESMSIAQLMMERSLNEGKNIVFDSSLRYAPFYEQLIDKIRKTRPDYTIEMVHVDADLEKMKAAAHARTASTGRVYTDDSIIESYESVKPNVEKLKHKFDRVVSMYNSHEGPPTLVKIETPSSLQNINLKLDQTEKVQKYFLKKIPDTGLTPPFKHVVFDLDYTIVSFPLEAAGKADDWRFVQAQGKTYRVYDHLGPVMKKLLENPDVKISFMSGGDYARNLELLKGIRPPELEGKSLFDIAYRSLSAHDLVDKHPDSKTFAKRWQKDLRKISTDLDNVVLVDDRIEFIRHSNSKGVSFGKVYSHFETWEDAKAAFRNTRPEVRKWIPSSKQEWLRDRNRFARIYAILDQSLAESKLTKKNSFAQIVGIHNQDTKTPWIDIGLKKLSKKTVKDSCIMDVLRPILSTHYLH